jgi:hypothetical protein
VEWACYLCVSVTVATAVRVGKPWSSVCLCSTHVCLCLCELCSLCVSVTLTFLSKL